MFDELKLNIFRSKIEGFAYDIYHPEFATYKIQTYLVINTDNGYMFIKYKKHSFNIDLLMNDMIENLEEIGYKPLSYWAINKQKTKVKLKSNTNHQNNITF